jgi:cellulose biosynthesis protein BcsQ
VIIPIMPEPMGLAMVPSFLETVEAVRLERMNPRLALAGVILTRSSARALVNQAALATLEEWFDGSVPILGEIRDSAKVQEAPSRGIAVSRYRAARQAADEYRRIAEVLRDTREQRAS